ncbi:ATP-binding protein [Thiobacillus sp.]|uniref:ATP-binding protein n=1 Tax=Thiobacillus sp. TaxID=924 RepID=UPI0025D48538|nr:ATP-binding protein [Thiobacillus sp.]
MPTAMFAGRYDEILALEKGLFQTKHNQPCNFMITGDRGIGKSSLLFYLKHVSNGNIECIEHGNFDFVSISVPVSDKLDIVTLLKLIERNITRELGKIEAVRSFLSETWSFVQRLRVMDSGISAAEQDSEVELQLDNFAYSLAETCKRVVNPERGEKKKDGILFLFDECDNATPALRIGHFFKTITEALQRHGCDNVMFILAGLPDTPEKLSKSHESSVRIFTHIKIEELGAADREYVIDKGLEEGNRINSEQTTITGNARNMISMLSEGYPHFIQQFAYSAFDVNADGEISDEDVLDAAFKTGGAIDAIGSRYYENAFYDRIKSDEYRQVLAIMAEKMNAWVTKAEIREKFTGDETTLSNALQALTSRKIILKNSSRIGEYRLQQRGFAIWIKLFGDRKKAQM